MRAHILQRNPQGLQQVNKEAWHGKADTPLPERLC